MARALEFDPDLAEAHTTLALLNSESSGDPRGLEEDLRKAAELSPGYATAHHWLLRKPAHDGSGKEIRCRHCS